MQNDLSGTLKRNPEASWFSTLSFWRIGLCREDSNRPGRKTRIAEKGHLPGTLHVGGGGGGGGLSPPEHTRNVLTGRRRISIHSVYCGHTTAADMVPFSSGFVPKTMCRKRLCVFFNVFLFIVLYVTNV